MFSFKFHASQRGQSASVFRVAIKDPVEVARSRIQILRINIQESEPEVRFGLRRSDRDGFLKLNPRFRRTLQSAESHSECAITRRPAARSSVYPADCTRASPNFYNPIQTPPRP